jgi:hypothetical protein
MNARKAVLGIVAVYLACMLAMGSAHAANEPRYDRFVSHRSGNVVRIPSRCWQEDSLAHLYMSDYDGAVLTLHCHHKGY